MCRKFRTLEECKARYKAVTVDGSVWRVKQKYLWWWIFVERPLLSFPLDSVVFEYPTQAEAEEACERFARADYTAQSAAWQ